MNVKFLAVLLLTVLLVCCKGEYNPSELRIFDYGAGFSMRTQPNGAFEVSGVDVVINSYYGSELSNVVVVITLPREIKRGEVLSSPPNISIEREGHKIAVRYKRILETDKKCFDSSECVGRKFFNIAIDSSGEKWSKPIEIVMTANFKESVPGISGGMEEGRYAKKILLYQNEKEAEKETKNKAKMNGRLFPGGRWIGAWEYLGATIQGE